LVSGAQNIGLSNHKLKSALKCTVWSQCTPVPDQTDGQTDEHNMFLAYLSHSFVKNRLCACVFKSRNAVLGDIYDDFMVQ